jgi:hypothetical protein
MSDMKRQTNAPLPTPDEVSREVANLTIDQHRRPTVPGVAAALAEERTIGADTRRHRTLARRREMFRLGTLWFFRAGSIAGFIALGIVLLRH